MFIYNNIGGKMKVLAIAVGVMSIIIGVLVLLIGLIGILKDWYYLSDFIRIEGLIGNAELFPYLLRIVIGLLIAIIGYISSWPLYGFGELIEQTTYIADRMSDK